MWQVFIVVLAVVSAVPDSKEAFYSDNYHFRPVHYRFVHQSPLLKAFPTLKKADSRSRFQITHVQPAPAPIEEPAQQAFVHREQPVVQPNIFKLKYDFDDEFDDYKVVVPAQYASGRSNPSAFVRSGYTVVDTDEDDDDDDVDDVTGLFIRKVGFRSSPITYSAIGNHRFVFDDDDRFDSDDK